MEGIILNLTGAYEAISVSSFPGSSLSCYSLGVCVCVCVCGEGGGGGGVIKYLGNGFKF